MASTAEYKFEGWMGLDKHATEENMVWTEFQPKAWEETDVDIRVTHCGMCGSDLHILRSGWGPTAYPCCVGHEITGIIVRVGSRVEGGLNVGDRVGVGAQADSCRKGDCEECASGLEQYCPTVVSTHGSYHFNGDMAYGGYALYHRTPSHFAFKIPDAIPSAEAAPMLCAGITTYSPLKHFGCGPDKKVGIIGLGGLGHFGILWAKAFGAEKVVAISRKASKSKDALKLGADLYIATEDDTDWLQKNARSLDLVLCTVSSSKTSIGDYLSLVRRDGVFIIVGLPEDGPLRVPVFALTQRRVKVAGSAMGSPADIREMLDFAAEKKVKPWVQVRPMKEANKALVDLGNGSVKYRLVLTNEVA